MKFRLVYYRLYRPVLFMHKQYDCTSLCPPWCTQCPLKLGGHYRKVGGHSKKIFSSALRRNSCPPTFNLLPAPMQFSHYRQFKIQILNTVPKSLTQMKWILLYTIPRLFHNFIYQDSDDFQVFPSLKNATTEFRLSWTFQNEWQPCVQEDHHHL